jgi:O-antigen/teichoic acid export membrane protein
MRAVNRSTRRARRRVWSRLGDRQRFLNNFWGLSDQALISATNFMTMVLLARSLTPTAFGYFSLVYMGLLFVQYLQFAVITQPHNVLGATRSGAEYAHYTSSTAIIQILFTVISALLVLGGGAFAHLAAWDIATLLFALAPALIAWQLQDFARRVLYTEGRLGAAFANDIISYGGQVVVVVALWRLGQLSGPAVLYALATTSALGIIVGAWQLRGSLSRHIEPAVFRENWQFGKWLGGVHIANWLSIELYVYLAAMILNVAAAGALRATMVLLGPLNILLFFLNSVLPTRFTRTLTTGGEVALHAQLKMAYTLTAPLLGAYCLLVAIFAEPLLQLMYGSNYVGYGGLVVLYAAFYFITYLGIVLSAALRAMKLTRATFVSYIYAALIAITFGWPLIWAAGAYGAVLGMILTSLIAVLFFWRAYRRELPPRGDSG